MTDPTTHIPILAAAIGWSQVIPIVLIVAGAVLLLVAIWRGRLPGQPAAAAQPPTSPATAQQVQLVMRDAEELAGLLAGQMDRQAARLERLISDADARIRQLERLTADVRAARPTDGTLAADPLNQRIFEMADEGMPPVEIARTLKQQTGKVQLILALRRK